MEAEWDRHEVSETTSKFTSPAGVRTISINFSPLAAAPFSCVSSTACRFRFPVTASSSFAAVRTALAIAHAMMLAFALLRADGS